MERLCFFGILKSIQICRCMIHPKFQFFLCFIFIFHFLLRCVFLLICIPTRNCFLKKLRVYQWHLITASQHYRPDDETANGCLPFKFWFQQGIAYVKSFFFSVFIWYMNFYSCNMGFQNFSPLLLSKSEICWSFFIASLSFYCIKLYFPLLYFIGLIYTFLSSLILARLFVIISITKLY